MTKPVVIEPKMRVWQVAERLHTTPDKLKANLGGNLKPGEENGVMGRTKEGTHYFMVGATIQSVEKAIPVGSRKVDQAVARLPADPAVKPPLAVQPQPPEVTFSEADRTTQLSASGVNWFDPAAKQRGLTFPLPQNQKGVTILGTQYNPLTGGLHGGTVRGRDQHGHIHGHGGNDYRTPIGTPVLSAAPGVVVFAGEAPKYGKVVYVNHPDGTQTRYAHLSAIDPRIREGGKVPRGFELGKSGDSGNAQGEPPHLHFEVRVARNGGKVTTGNSGSRTRDPLPLVSNFSSRQLVAQQDQHRRNQAVASSTEPPITLAHLNRSRFPLQM